MNASLVVALAVAVSTLATAATIGVLVRHRSGVVRAIASGPAERPHGSPAGGRDDIPGDTAHEVDTSDLGLSRTGPTLVHFSAAWCGPYAAVRRACNQVCDELPHVTHVEIDMETDSTAARRLSVLSLPTTFIFDADGRQRYRAAGVPKASDLRSTLRPLLA